MQRPMPAVVDGSPKALRPQASVEVKRVNYRLLLGLVVAAAVLGTCVLVLHRYQVNRNAGSLAKLARQRLREGKMSEAMGLFSRYLGMRPDDVAVQREYAELVLSRAQDVGASQNDLKRAYGSLEEAVRRNPEDDELRLKLAEFQVRVCVAEPAHAHLELRRTCTCCSRALSRARATSTPLRDRPATSSASMCSSGPSTRIALRSTRPIHTCSWPRSSTSGWTTPRPPTPCSRNSHGGGGDDAVAWLALARWHRQRGDLDAAAEDMDKAQAIAPESPDVVWGGFELALAKGDVAAARAIATRARELFPVDERVYRGLASLALQGQDLATAETVLREGVAQIPGKASLLLMLSDTLLQRGKFDEADQVLAQVQELFGSANAAVGLLQSRVLIARRRWTDARRRLAWTTCSPGWRPPPA